MMMEVARQRSVCRDENLNLNGVWIMEIYWIFLIPAIVCALFADKIDAYAKTNKKLKKVILVFSVGVVLVSLIGIIATIFA